MSIDVIGRYLRTVMRMKPGMIISRLRGQKRLTAEELSQQIEFVDVSICIPQTDLCGDYLARFDVDGILEGSFLLINERFAPDLNIWCATQASHLWNFNLHYFEYGIALGGAYKNTHDNRYWKCFKSLVEQWINNCEYAKGDAWHPYTISLRLINWLVCRDLFREAIEADSAFDSLMKRSMYLQYRHLLINQETHLLANHYFENLKTLVIFSKLFGDEYAFRLVWDAFVSQLNEQVLPDGIHFEKSMMYHKLVLEGIMRVALVLDRFGDTPDILIDKMQQMLDALCSIEKGMDRTPLFNDSGEGVAKTATQLSDAIFATWGLEGDCSILSFPSAGYYKLYDEEHNAALMIDAGLPGPSYMLGHAHCDALSFELFVNGIPIVVNSGTYAYQTKRRQYFRSTAAHNTVLVGEEEQLECWGEHRVGRSYKQVRLISRQNNQIRLELTLNSGSVVSRSVSVCEGVLKVEDELINGPRCECKSFIRFAENFFTTRLSSAYDICWDDCCYSPEFGVMNLIPFAEVTGVGSVSYSFDYRNDEVGCK